VVVANRDSFARLAVPDIVSGAASGSREEGLLNPTKAGLQNQTQPSGPFCLGRKISHFCALDLYIV